METLTLLLVPRCFTLRQGSFIRRPGRSVLDIMKGSPVHHLVIACIAAALLCVPAFGYSDNAVALYNKGNQLVQSENLTLAVQAFDAAIALEPSYFEAYNGKADALNRDGQFGPALAASNRSLEINPGHTAGWINRGQILYNIGYWYEDKVLDQKTADRIYGEQLAAFEKAISFDPQNAEAWFNKGYALAGMKRYDEAIAAFDKVISLDPKYQQIQANRKIAENLRAASAPVYLRYALPIAIAALFAIGAIVWLIMAREEN
jgi:tetratricopeptide (TPR) repeat protein